MKRISMTSMTSEFSPDSGSSSSGGGARPPTTATAPIHSQSTDSVDTLVTDSSYSSSETIENIVAPAVNATRRRSNNDELSIMGVGMDVDVDMDHANQDCVTMGLKRNRNGNVNVNANNHRQQQQQHSMYFDNDADTVVSSNKNDGGQSYKYHHDHDQYHHNGHATHNGNFHVNVHVNNNNNGSNNNNVGNNNVNNNGKGILSHNHNDNGNGNQHITETQLVHTQTHSHGQVRNSNTSNHNGHANQNVNANYANSTTTTTVTVTTTRTPNTSPSPSPNSHALSPSPVPLDIQNTNTHTPQNTPSTTPQPTLMQQQHSFPSGGASSTHSASNQTTGTNTSGGIASTTTTTSLQQQSFSLPPELKKILHEVARTGKCTSLPWTASGISSFNAKRSLKYRRAAKRKRQHEKQMAKELKAAASHINASGGNAAQHTIVKWENNSYIDDNSSVKSNTSKVSNASKVSNTSRAGVEKKVVIEAHVDHIKEASISVGGGSGPGSNASAPSHADSSSVAGSLASQGSKRSEDLTTSTRTSIQTDLKRKRFYRDQSCASSCSESVSSAGGGSTISVPSSSASMGPLCLSLPFRTLRGALRLAVALVLEYSYKHRGGYKLSPAEKRRFEVLQQQANANRGREKNASFLPSQTDVAFMERRMRLLKMLGGGKSARSAVTRVLSGNASDGGFASDTSFDSALRRKASEDFAQSNHYGPPFTIQRVAEVLLMPERYYVQTHKLCNALEKLLLVTSPSTAFGGVTGGDTSQNRREEREMAALADKKERDESEQRQRSRRLKRRISSSSSDGCDPIIQMNVSVETPESKRLLLANTGQPVYPISAIGIATANTSNITNEQIRRLSPNRLISDARMLSVMTVDTVGPVGPPVSVNMVQSVDNSYPHTMVVQNQTFSGNPNAFPPGPLGVAKGVTDDALRALQDNANPASPCVIQHASALNRPPSPSLYSSQDLNQLINSHQASVLQGHHGGVLDAAAFRAGQNVQMEIVIDPASGNSAVSPVQSGVTATDVAYLDQVEVGRSSASNSDIDSESDDISFDDSASDRSDGSDFDPGTVSGLSEPFTAARVMALNRMQQQHRREQYLQDRALRQVPPCQPPLDSEYQSGDSVDSTMAEDSCGSDSSSSSFTD